MKAQIEKYVGWRDAIELVIALWLLISPVALNFITIGHASMVAFLIGSIVICTSMLGISTEQAWEEWVTFALALFLMASPWLLSYSSSIIATVNALVSGGLLVVFSLITVRHDNKIQRLAKIKQPF